MKTTKLSDKIEDGGCVIEANGNKGLLDIDRNEIEFTQPPRII